MLVLARQLNERIVMPTVPATIEVVAIRPNGVRLGIDAPPEVTILREEVLRRRGGLVVSTPSPVEADAETRLAQVRHVLRNRLDTLALALELMRKQLRTSSSSELEAMLRRMEEEVRTLDQQLRTLLYDPLDETSLSACVEAVSVRCLDSAEGGLAI